MERTDPLPGGVRPHRNIYVIRTLADHPTMYTHTGPGPQEGVRSLLAWEGPERGARRVLTLTGECLHLYDAHGVGVFWRLICVFKRCHFSHVINPHTCTAPPGADQSPRAAPRRRQQRRCGRGRHRPSRPRAPPAGAGPPALCDHHPPARPLPVGGGCAGRGGGPPLCSPRVRGFAAGKHGIRVDLTLRINLHHTHNTATSPPARSTGRGCGRAGPTQAAGTAWPSWSALSPAVARRRRGARA